MRTDEEYMDNKTSGVYPENMKLFEDQISVMLERAWWEWERNGWPVDEKTQPHRCYISPKYFIDFDKFL